MRTRRIRTITSAGALLLLAAALAGCSGEAGIITEDQTANTGGVEQQISMSLTQQSGVQPVSVGCPDEMVIEDGKHYECEVVHPQTGPQRVDVTMHADGTVDFFVPTDQG